MSSEQRWLLWKSSQAFERAALNGSGTNRFDSERFWVSLLNFHVFTLHWHCCYIIPMFEIACTEPRQVLNYCFIKTAVRSSRFRRGSLKTAKLYKWLLEFAVRSGNWQVLCQLATAFLCNYGEPYLRHAPPIFPISAAFQTAVPHLGHKFISRFRHRSGGFNFPSSRLHSAKRLNGKTSRSQFFMHFLSLPAEPLMKFMQSFAWLSGNVGEKWLNIRVACIRWTLARSVATTNSLLGFSGVRQVSCVIFLRALSWKTNEQKI